YIFHNEKGGVVIDGGKHNTITYNVFFENDTTKGRPTAFAISHINNGNNNKPKPTIDDYNWINGKIQLIGHSSAAGDSIHIYLGEGGYEEARIFLGSGISDGSKRWEIMIDT